MPRAAVITPNICEARRLSGRVDPAECAAVLLGSGCEHVLITGTHSDEPEVVNRLFERDGTVHTYHWPRLPATYHGSGCTLAAAVAALVARGFAVEPAVLGAQEFTWQSLRDGFRLGHGQLLPNRWGHGVVPNP